MTELKVIVASTRPTRVGAQVADWFVGRAENHGAFKVEVLDLAQINLPFLDEPEPARLRRYVHQHTRDWSAKIDSGDAYVLVMPEYNAGFNAPLKNAIDFLYHEWRYKPVGFVSYGMTSAGLRAVQMIKQCLTVLSMFPIADGVAIPLKNQVDENMRLMPSSAMATSADTMLTGLHRAAIALAPLRSGQRAEA